MRLHRFYISSPIGDQNHLRIESSEDMGYAAMIRQWRDVFRYLTGSRVVLFDGTGNEYLAMIEKLTSDSADLIIVEKTKDDNAARETLKNLTKRSVKDDTAEATAPAAAAQSPKAAEKQAKAEKSAKESALADEGGRPAGICLLVSILKGDNFEVVVQKATELGVDHIVPILCDRTIKKNINQTRCKKIAVEAAEQSGRVTIPEVHVPVKLAKAIENFDGKLIVCMQGGEKMSPKMLSSVGQKPIGFIVGPEGGWSDKEAALFQKSKIQTVSISENVLRAETAAITIVALSKAL